MIAEDLVMQRARTSATMVLTKFYCNILTPAPGGLSSFHKDTTAELVWSVTFLLMTWGPMEPWYQQAWYWPQFVGTFHALYGGG